MEKDSSLAPAIINHVPSTEEIQAARQIEATHDIYDAMPREMIDLVMLGSGVKVERSEPKPYVPRPPQFKPRQETADAEPYVEPEHERRISGAELKKLREELAKSGE